MKLRQILAAAAIGIAAVSFGQTDFDRQIANQALLSMPAVKADIKLSAEQAKKIDAARKTAASALEKLRKANPPASSQQLSAVGVTMRNEIFKALQPAQITRLREISLQTTGPMGVMNSAVQAKLALSKEQKGKLSNAMKSYTTKAMELARPKDPKAKPTPEDQKKRQAASEKLQQELAGAIREILTAPQLNQYRALLGKPVAGLKIASKVKL